MTMEMEDQKEETLGRFPKVRSEARGSEYHEDTGFEQQVDQALLLDTLRI